MGASGGFMLLWEAIPTWASGGSMGGGGGGGGGASGGFIIIGQVDAIWC